MQKLGLWISLGLMLGAFGASAEKAPETETSPLLIDARSAYEFSQGHAEGAVNIPHNKIKSQIAAVAPDKTAEIHLYCKSGARSGYAARVMKKLGYTKAINKGSLQAVLKERGVKSVK